MSEHAGQTATAHPADGIRPATRKEEALWLLDRLVPEAGANNIATALRVPGRFDRPALQAALSAVVRRNPVLRSVFQAEDGELTRRFLPAGQADPRVEYVGGEHGDEYDGAGGPADPTAADGGPDLTSFAARPFDLAAGPLLRLGCFTRDQEETVCIVAHHLVFDTRSAAVFVEQFADAYNAALAEPDRAGEPVHPAEPAEPGGSVPGGPEPDDPAPVPTPASARSLEYWAGHLAGFAPDGLALRCGRPEPSEPTLAGGRVLRVLSDQALSAVRRMQKDLRAPEAVVLLAAYYVLLAAHGAGPDLVVGAPVNTRGRDEAATMGYRVNTLPLRLRVDRSDDFRSLVRRTRDVFLHGLNHADVSADELLALVPRSGAGWRKTVFRHVFNYVPDEARPPLLFGGREARHVPVENGSSKFDLELYFTSGPDRIEVRAVHYLGVLAAADARAMVERYDALLVHLGADPERAVGQAPVFGEQDRAAAPAARARAETAADAVAEPDSRAPGPEGAPIPAGRLLDLWRELLKRDDVGDDADLFRQGGTSMLAVVVAQRVREATGIRLRLADVFAYPTPAALAERLRTLRADAARPETGASPAAGGDPR